MRKTVGEVLVDLLEAYSVDTVFGIPGVHTVELYRGLATANIRHITPRNEQSAGFMADGYARVSGKPGVCLLITGPGLTNAITAMGQARADSIPMLIISGVNKAVDRNQEVGHLHELPDQIAMMKTIAISTETIERGDDLEATLDRAFAAMTAARPGPVHIEIPLDVMSEVIDIPDLTPRSAPAIEAPKKLEIETAAAMCSAARRPVLLIGGGALAADVQKLAECLDAPVVTTINARGVMAEHPLLVPASPSLPSVRALLADADLVIAAGTQFGPTDYDIYVDGAFPTLQKLIRIDVDPRQAAKGQVADHVIIADAAVTIGEITAMLADE
ncbi:UNVERIFIED_CONTAM: hypothetical protein GTU68_032686, partial [Idotea baltica]|nr:hypothetical protein [Idotea baltica]